MTNGIPIVTCTEQRETATGRLRSVWLRVRVRIPLSAEDVGELAAALDEWEPGDDLDDRMVEAAARRLNAHAEIGAVEAGDVALLFSALDGWVRSPIAWVDRSETIAGLEAEIRSAFRERKRPPPPPPPAPSVEMSTDDRVLAALVEHARPMKLNRIAGVTGIKISTLSGVMRRMMARRLIRRACFGQYAVIRRG